MAANESTNAFRRHWSLDPAVTFLNHGSFGACPLPVLERQAELRARLESEPVRFFLREYPERMAEVRAALAAFVGADPAGLTFVANATTGVNTVLASHGFRAGDELLVTDHAYRACANALEHFARSSGATVVVAQVPFPIESEEQVLAAIEGRVGKRTRLALIDHVTSPTGIIFPIERIVAALAERGVETLVDGAHAPGMVPLDLARVGAAYYTGNCHKWLCAPKGAAFLWVCEARRQGMRPLVISHAGSLAESDPRKFLREFDWGGTEDPTARLCVPAAIEFMGSLLSGGWAELRRRNRALVIEGRGLLLEALGVPAPAPESMLGSLAAVPLPLLAGAEELPIDPLQDELFFGHSIEVPVMNWPSPRLRLLRISAQIYNERAEYERLARYLPESRVSGA